MTAPIGATSALGARVCLTLQALGVALLAFPVLMLLMALSAMVGSTTADIHSLTRGYILLTAPAVVLHVLAAIEVGRSQRGKFYLFGSTIYTAVHVFYLVFYGAPGICIGAAFGGLAIATLVFAKGAWDAEEDLRGGVRRYVPEALTALLGAALIAGLLVWNNMANDVENRHPAGAFTGNEAPAVLEEAVAEPLALITSVEGIPDPAHSSSDDFACSDGAGWDDEWSQYQRSYRIEGEFLATEGPGLELVETLREGLPELGWEITYDEEWGEGARRIGANREDGVTLYIGIARHISVEVNTGCVKNPSETD